MSKAFEPQSLEFYLAQIAHELRDLPASARADEMREIEAHLRAMIEARGYVTEALAQFGKPRKVGRELQRAWERKHPEAWWRVALAPVAGLVFYLATFMMLLGASELLANFELRPNTDWAHVLTLMVLFLAHPFLTGVIVGSISPRRGQSMVLLISAMLLVSLTLLPNTADLTSNAFLLTFELMVLLLILAGVHFGSRRARRRATNRVNS